ncbi:ABC transporter ATP-binding protein [Paenibacillus sp. NPDC058174]|uniref:ABC transporter ATP-binding protein n=1 Tax=Paenibacillus sp. NPDC058174 TaxID=3346366 RepID=UPI0036DB2129
MKATLILLKKLYAAAGSKVLLHLTLMLLVSCLEGIGIFLIIPLLSIIGAFDMNVDAVPFVGSAMEALERLKVPLNLPMVLAAYILLVGGQALLQRNQTVLSEKISQKYVKSLRVETHRSLLRAKWEFFLKRRNSDFNQMLSTELNRVSRGIDLFLMLMSSVAFTVIQIGFAMWLSFQLTAIIIASGLVLSLVSRRFIRKSAQYGQESSRLFKSYFAGLNDHFGGMKDIKSNQLESSHISWFQTLAGKIESNYLRAYRLYANSQFLYRMTSVLLVAVFVYFSITFLHVAAEQLLLIVLIFTRLWPRFISIQSSLERLVSEMSAFESLTTLQRESDEAREAHESLDDKEIAPLRVEGSIACSGIHYRYDSGPEAHYALKNIDITIPANQMTAIVGKSGAGKSTLVDLLMGLIKPNSGKVLIDGQELTDERLYGLRQSIGYVAQDPFLFHGSLRENLKLVVPEATDEQMWEALRFSASDQFVRNLPQGLDTIVGDRGVKLSGGERQRIVLARAILREPSILVLDEATSALDNENELRIKEALERLRGKMTIIVIAHRLSTIRNANQVIVLEDGEIVQQGGYAQLSSEPRGVFQRLLASQS